MSHTTTIQTLLLSDRHAIQAAINELASKGVKCSLLENAIPRAYYDNQKGMGKADMVIKLEDSPYDVGIYKRDDGTYETRADYFAGHVQRQLGVTPGKGDNPEQAKLGKFFSLYGAHAAMRSAIQKGYSVLRSDQKDGSIQLTINT